MRSIRGDIKVRNLKPFKCSILAALVLWVSTGSQTVLASVTYDYPGNCYNADATTVHCYGTMADMAAQSADPYRFATFVKWAYPDNSVSLQFYMRVNDNSYSCTAPASMVDAWNSALNVRALFFVEMNTSTGVCTYIGSYTSSSNHL